MSPSARDWGVLKYMGIAKQFPCEIFLKYYVVPVWHHIRENPPPLAILLVEGSYADSYILTSTWRSLWN